MNTLYNFDPLNLMDGVMDGTADNMFAQDQQQAKSAGQSFPTPVDSNMSSFYSGFIEDEAIDTTNFDLLNNGQTQVPLIDSFTTLNADLFGLPSGSTYSSQDNLNMGSFVGTNPWDGQLTAPAITEDFMSAQASSFNSPSVSTAHKRSLECITENLPQPKRQVLADYQSLSPFTAPSTVPSTTADSSWTMETRLTQSEYGLTDDAADMCATWFSKYGVLPSDQHIQALSLLTLESPSAIRQWFGKMLKQGLSGHDSAYKSQSTMGQQDQSANTMDTQSSIGEAPSGNSNHETTQIAVTQPSTLRRGKKSCTPTSNMDLLRRDENKIFQCTRKCGKRYGRKCDWKRSEEEGYPSKSWQCSLCRTEGVGRVKPCYRRYHFVQHFRNIHPGVDFAEYEASSVVHSETEFPRRCGFCPEVFASRQERIDHIADHFRKGKCMLDWKEDGEDDSNQDDGDDDEDGADEDKPESDSFQDQSPSIDSSDRDTPDQSGSKRQGGGGGSGAGNGGQSYSNGFNFSSGKQYYQTDTTDQTQPLSNVIGQSSPFKDSNNLMAKESTVCDLLQTDHSHSSSGPQEHQEDASATNYQQRVATPRRSFAETVGKLGITDDDVKQTEHPTPPPGASPPGRVLRSVGPKSNFQTNIETSKGLQPQGNAPNTVVSRVGSYTSRIQASALDSMMEFLHQFNQFRSKGLSGSEITTKEKPKILPNVTCGICRPLERLQHQPCSVDCAEHSESKLQGDLQEQIQQIQDLWKLFKRANEIPSDPTLSQTVIANSKEPPNPQILSEMLLGIGGLSTVHAAESREPNANQFLSVKLLGTGGFSTVDEVIHRHTKLHISRKTFKNRDKSAIKELKKEVEILRKLRHPHIIRLVGTYLRGNKASLLLSPVAETTLAAWLEQSKIENRPDVAEVIAKMYGCLASSVRYLHQQRPVIKHMDIKPQNILLTQGDYEFPHVILCDFGISQISEDSNSNSIESTPLTRQYCAPEIANAKSRGSMAADIWSLGCVFLEMTEVLLKQTSTDDDLAKSPGARESESNEQGNTAHVCHDFKAPNSLPELTTPARRILRPGELKEMHRYEQPSEQNANDKHSPERELDCEEKLPKESYGGEGKYYWQNLLELHNWLTFLQEREISARMNVVLRTIQLMLSGDPDGRPDAATLTTVFTPAPCCLSWPSQSSYFPGPLEESQELEMLIQKDNVDWPSTLGQSEKAGISLNTDDPCSSTKRDGHPKLISGITSSERKYGSYSPEAWLHQCSTEHPSCNSGLTSPKSLPTRLLEIFVPENLEIDGCLAVVGANDQVLRSSVRLVCSTTLPTTVTYAALSHSTWTQESMPILTTSSLEALRKQLPQSELPREVNEALAVSRRLGIRYLWVDSLCVIQDSEEDRRNECNAMASVYRNALLTLVIDNPVSTSIRSTADHPMADRRWENQIWSFPPSGDDISHSSVWDTRTWSLQERLLSKRLLHLTEGQMYWECCCLKASETFPKGLPPLLWEKVHSKSEPASSLAIARRRIIHGGPRLDEFSFCDSSNRNAFQFDFRFELPGSNAVKQEKPFGKI